MFSKKMTIRALCANCALMLSACASLEQQTQVLEQQQQQNTQLQSLISQLAEQKEGLEALELSVNNMDERVQDMQTAFAQFDENLNGLNNRLSSQSAVLKVGDANASISEKTNPSTKKAKQNLKPEKAILGRVEWAKIEAVDRYLKARIDTGAKSSSIHGTDVQFFERDGERWVMFKINTHEKTIIEGEKNTYFEAPLVRTVKIKQASSEESEKRAVIKMMVKVGEISDEVEFSITDRANMNYPLLLGRNFLRDVALVDVAKVFTRKRDDQTETQAEGEP